VYVREIEYERRKEFILRRRIDHNKAVHIKLFVFMGCLVLGGGDNYS
jgi:hypothetical protein